MTDLPRLLKIEDVAETYGIPKTVLLRKAQETGYLIEIGTAKRMLADEVREFLNTCRSVKKARASTSVDGKTGDNPTTSSEKRATQMSALALTTSKKPSASSRNTLANVTAMTPPPPKK